MTNDRIRSRNASDSSDEFRARRIILVLLHLFVTVIFSFETFPILWRVRERMTPFRYRIAAYPKSNDFFERTHRNHRISYAHLHQDSSFDPSRNVQPPFHNIAVIGGGLAGLSTVYHLLQQEKNPHSRKRLNITVIDKTLGPGLGGASAIAGGLLHPFSPTGKLIHLGEEGLQSTNHLLDAARKYEPNSILRNQIFRLALSSAHVLQLQETANRYPRWATWMNRDQLLQCYQQDHADGKYALGDTVLGGLRLSNGCKVVHVPTYLQGLWKACEQSSILQGDSVTWSCEDTNHISYDWKIRLQEFDTVVFSAGSGLFQDSIMKNAELPIQLVRGQSIEINITGSNSSCAHFEALLCGKYITPLPQSKDHQARVMVGATHEFSAEALNKVAVVDELRDATSELSPWIWFHGTMDEMRSGFRVQSQRSRFGRLPIVDRQEIDLHYNAWIFTGLSSRGLIYHGIFGYLLSSAILCESNKKWDQLFPVLGWWRKARKL